MKAARRFVVLVAVFVASCGSDSPPTCNLDGGVPLARTAWPKFRGDSANTGHSKADLSAFTGDLVEKWRFRTGGAVSSSPNVGLEGEIYIGSGDTRVYRLDKDGSLKWQFNTANAVTTGPAVDIEGQVFVTSNDGNLYTLEALDGEQLRSPVQLVGVLSSPNLGSSPNEGVLYVGSVQTGAFALCPNNVLRWAQQVVPVAAVPAIGVDGNVYFAGALGARTLAELDAANGQPNWIFTATAPIAAAPVVANDANIYVVDTAGRMFVVDPVRGTSPGVHYAVGAGVFASPALTNADPDDPVRPGESTLFVADQSGTLTAIDPEASEPSQRLRWTFTIPSGAAINSSPAVTRDGTILFGADDGFVYGVRDLGDSAELRWAFATGGPVRSSPAVDFDRDDPGNDITIYIGSNDGNVYALRPE